MSHDSIGKFMISVDGNNAPSVIHNTYEEALHEANRIACSNRSRYSTIRILRIEALLVPSNSHTLITSSSSDMGELP